MIKDKSAIENNAEKGITDFEVSYWVVVQCDKEECPGEITDVLSKEFVVSAMHPAGNCFKWPNPEGECIYPFSAVIAKINPPEVAGRRGQFLFDYFNWQLYMY